eukprot:Pgem_evm2s7928
MELVENETLQEKKELSKEYESAIATTLRLAKPYFNPRISLCADSWSWKDKANKQLLSTCATDEKADTGGKVGGWEDLFTTHEAWHKYFSGFIGMSETNSYLACTFFNRFPKKSKMTHRQIRLNLAQQLVNNGI